MTLPSGKSRIEVIALIVLVLASRLPSIFLGYGADGDAWRVAWSSSAIWHEGVYQLSRFPGFPVYEFLNAPFVGLGSSLASNAATLLGFLISLMLFRKLLYELDVPSVNILVWTFAFLPILWVNSTVTMDYLWGLLFILSAFFVSIRKKYILAAILIGLACGTRLTHILFLLPIFFLIGNETGRGRRFAMMIMIAMATALACYLPVLLRKELWNDIQSYITDLRHPSLIQRVGFFTYRSVYATGLLGAIGIAFLALRQWRVLYQLWSRRDRRMLLASVGIALPLITFFILPDEREYLIPMLPFVLIVIGLVFTRNQLAVVSLLLLSYNFFSLDLIKHDTNRAVLNIHPTAGYLVHDFRIRLNYQELREAVAHVQLDDSTIVMTGLGPIFWFENPNLNHYRGIGKTFNDPTDQDVSVSRENDNVVYVYKLTHEQFSKFVQLGYSIYYLRDSKAYLESFLDYDLGKAGAIPIDIMTLPPHL